MGRVSNAHGSGAWLQGPGGRGEGCCTCREEAGHQPTQCGQKPSGKLQIGNVFSTVGLPQGSRLRTAAGGLGRGSLCTYTAAQPSWRERQGTGKLQTPLTLELARVMAHDICLLMALTNLVIHTQDTSQVFD